MSYLAKLLQGLLPAQSPRIGVISKQKVGGGILDQGSNKEKPRGKPHSLCTEEHINSTGSETEGEE